MDEELIEAELIFTFEIVVVNTVVVLITVIAWNKNKGTVVVEVLLRLPPPLLVPGEKCIIGILVSLQSCS